MSPAKQSNWFREGFFGACSDRTRLTFHAKDFLPPALGWFSYPPHLLRRMQKAINIVQVRVETESEDD
jgi:hypothetical protein